MVSDLGFYHTHSDDENNGREVNDHGTASDDSSGGRVGGLWSGPLNNNISCTTHVAEWVAQGFVKLPPCLIVETASAPSQWASQTTAAAGVRKADGSSRCKEERRM